MAPQKPTKKSPNKPADKPGSAVAELLATLDLEPLEENLFRGRSPQDGWQRVFGGQVLGQALVGGRPHGRAGADRALAARLLPARRRPEASDHLRGRAHARRRQLHHPAGQGDPARPADVRHERLVPQRRGGYEHQRADAQGAAAGRPAERSGADGRAGRPAAGEHAELLGARAPDRACARSTSRAISLARSAGARAEHLDAGQPGACRTTLPLHQCVLAYASDFTLLDTALIAHGKLMFDKDIQLASLDHALWLHRPFRADDWLLYAQDSPIAPRRARLLPRQRLHPRRSAGGLRGPGRTDAATQIALRAQIIVQKSRYCLLLGGCAQLPSTTQFGSITFSD